MKAQNHTSDEQCRRKNIKTKEKSKNRTKNNHAGKNQKVRIVRERNRLGEKSRELKINLVNNCASEGTNE